MEKGKYDFFISHASEDKESFVRPLAEKLIAKGFRVWYDEFEIKIGDSLFDKISEGIRDSVYGIIVLSKYFLVKSWTKKELVSLFNKEILTENNIILPIWLDITKEEVYNFSPLLIDKYAISIKEKDIEKVINQIQKKTGIKKITNKIVEKKVKKIIEFNPQRKGKYFIDLENRINSIFLYQKEFENYYINLEDNVYNEIDVDIMRRKLQQEYNIPNGVWLNSESYSNVLIKKTIQISKKWLNRKLNYSEVTELEFIINELLDTDLSYIFFNIPHAYIIDEITHQSIIEGILEIGIIDTNERIKSKNYTDKVYDEIYTKYYSI